MPKKLVDEKMAIKLIISIDTEEDMPNWRPEKVITCKNITSLPRLHQLFKKYDLKPTYLITYPVLSDQISSDILKTIHKDGSCEMGAHLHAWNTPPLETKDRQLKASYLYDYPKAVQYKKLRTITDLFIERFGFAPASYRAGRYGFDSGSARILRELGYIVDSSIAPNWDLSKDGGPCYLDFPEFPYILSNSDIKEPGDSGLLEAPITIALVSLLPPAFKKIYHLIPNIARIKGVLNRLNIARITWLRPTNYSFLEMKQLVDFVCKKGCNTLNLMFHSSEIVPGCSPYNRTQQDVAAFIQRLNNILDYLTGEKGVQGITLSSLAREILKEEEYN